jgi:cell division protease FtsH
MPTKDSPEEHETARLRSAAETALAKRFAESRHTTRRTSLSRASALTFNLGFGLAYIALGSAILLIVYLLVHPAEPRDAPYSYVQQLLRSGDVATCALADGAIILHTKDGRHLRAKVPAAEAQSLWNDIVLSRVKLVDPMATRILLWTGIATLVATWSSSTLLTILHARWRARQRPEARAVIRDRLFPYERKVTFREYGGPRPEAIQRAIESLKEPERFIKKGGRASKGILLIGPPGTGKTLLARITAGEANAPIFSFSALELYDVIPGVGATSIYEIFDSAQRNSPAVIFIDNVDAIARRRSDSPDPLALDHELALGALLISLDNWSENDAVIIFGATNRPDLLDEALFRAGRFDTIVELGYPEANQIEAILRVHTRTVPLAEDVELDEMATRLKALMAKATGADAQNIVTLAAIEAARADSNKVYRSHFLAAIERHVASQRLFGHA